MKIIKICDYQDFNPRFPRGKRPSRLQSFTMADMISIHASRGGSDQNVLQRQSRCLHFNPCFPRGKRRPVVSHHVVFIHISIHASREGSDLKPINSFVLGSISIHASREGSDGACHPFLPSSVISIHASRGGSDNRQERRRLGVKKFQSTLPAGEATPYSL